MLARGGRVVKEGGVLRSGGVVKGMLITFIALKSDAFFLLTILFLFFYGQIKMHFTVMTVQETFHGLAFHHFVL